MVFKIRPSQEILKIRDGTPLEAEGISTYRKKPSKLLGLAFSSKLDVPSNVVQKKRVTRILVFKIRPSQEILKIQNLKIRDGTPLEAEGILTYRKMPSKLLEILKIRDGTPFGGGRNFDIPKKALETARPSQEILKIRDVAQIMVFKIRPSQEILKIRDGTPLEAEGISTYRKKPSKLLGLAFSSKLDVPSNVVQKKRVTRILVFKIRPSQEILKILARIMVFKIRPSQENLKIRDGTPLEAEGILTYRKMPSKLLEILKIRDGTPFGGGRNFDIPKKALETARPSQEILKIRDGTPLEMPSQEILKIRDGTPLEMPSQEILKIRDGTPLEAEGILTYRKRPSKLLVAQIMVFKIRPSQEILKIRDGTPLEAEGISTYRKKPSKLLGLAFSSKLDVPSNVVQKKRVTRILVFKIRPSQEILKIQNLKIRDGTPLEAEGILTYRKMPSKLLEILKIRDGTPFGEPSQEILKIRDGTPLE
ncbi:hypothetical protein OROMI_005350 [Orobanche minor]